MIGCSLSFFVEHLLLLRFPSVLRQRQILRRGGEATEPRPNETLHSKAFKVSKHRKHVRRHVVVARHLLNPRTRENTHAWTNGRAPSPLAVGAKPSAAVVTSTCHFRLRAGGRSPLTDAPDPLWRLIGLKCFTFLFNSFF